MKTEKIVLAIILSAGMLFTAGKAAAQASAPVLNTSATSTTMAAVNVGQTLTLNSVSYKVSTKKQLATGVEYYTVLPTANVKAKAVSYVRSNNTYNPTVFTLAQYEAFVASGKASSFGTVKSMVMGGKTVKYVTSGSTIAIFSVKPTGGVQVYEFKDDKVLALAPGNTGGSSDCKGSPLGEPLCCRIGCIDPTRDYGDCAKKCPNAVALSIHALSSTKSIVL